MSLKTGSPFVFINDSGGARVQEGIDSLSGYGKVFYTNVMLSGAVPQISLICGPCAGGAAYSPALTDFIIQTRQAQMFITGPQVIKQVTGESGDGRAAGRRRRAHGATRASIHFVAEDDQRCGLALPEAAQLPAVQQPGGPAARARPTGNVDPNPDAATTIVPAEGKKGYDVRERHRARWWTSATSWRCRPASRRTSSSASRRIAGRIGRHRSPTSRRCLAGALDINASNKAARFIRFCNAFNIPLRHLRRRAGLPAGRAAGVRRHHPPRRQDAVRLLGGHGAEDHGHPAQGLRRRLPGDVRQGPGRRPRLRLADGRDRGDGRRGRGGDRLPQGDRRGRGQGGAAQGADRASTASHFANPYVAAGRRLVDDVIEPGRDAHVTWRRRSSACTPSASCGRRRSTG